MRLASLYSGGKDSTFAIRMAQEAGHEVACLLTVFPESAESRLLHHPNIGWTGLQSESMNIPQISTESDAASEISCLKSLVMRAADEFGVQGIVHGGIRSRFQRERFEGLCAGAGLEPVSPLWGVPAKRYMEDLLSAGFEFVITSVSAGGLDESWLGRRVSAPDLDELVGLSERFGFNLDFEGGEAETFVVDCPLFSRPVSIVRSESEWDGYRGRFEIVDAVLECDA